MFEKMRPIEKREVRAYVSDNLITSGASVQEQLSYGAMLLDLAEQHGIKTVRAAVEQVAIDDANFEDEDEEATDGT